MKRWCPALTLAFLMLPLLVPRASLAENELYGGAGIGYSTFTINDLNFEGAALSTRQFLGFRYGDYVGLEFGFTDFGKVSDQVPVTFGEPSQSYSVDTSGYNVSLVGIYPLNRELMVFGKVGVLRWDSEATLESIPLSASLSGDDLMWGLGIDFRGTGRIHLRVEASFADIKFADSWWVLSTSLIYGIPFGR